MPLRRLKIHGGLYLLYVLFFTVGILLIPFLYDRPGIVQLALAVTSAVGLVYFGDSRVLIGWIHRRNLRVSILLFTGIILSLVSIPHHGSFYFSDDAIRHIHDGHALLNGVDVYGVPPAERAAVLNRLPNHPELGTIYFPFTQLQALAGAFLDRCCLQSSARVNGT
ncbi:MAG: hypothetical protein KDK30_17555, partial [Leptospiraceae bacterium]|nr:hypothetical protein [Leptospiraceae bacterium]